MGNTGRTICIRIIRLEKRGHNCYSDWRIGQGRIADIRLSMGGSSDFLKSGYKLEREGVPLLLVVVKGFTMDFFFRDFNLGF